MTTFRIRRRPNAPKKRRPQDVLREYGPLERWRLKELTRLDDLSLTAALDKAIAAGIIVRKMHGMYDLRE